MEFDVTFLTGWCGALLVLAAFYVTVVKAWDPGSGRYLGVSNIAAGLLIVNAALNEAYPFLVVNAALVVVTVYTLVRKGLPKWR